MLKNVFGILYYKGYFSIKRLIMFEMYYILKNVVLFMYLKVLN